MIKINKSPVLTSKNYGVNYFEIDEEVLNQNLKNDIVVIQKNDICVCKKTFKNKPHSLISDKLDNQIQNHTNFSKNFVLGTDTKDVFEISFQNQKILCDALQLTVNSQVSAKAIVRYSTIDTMYHNGALKIYVKENANLDLAVVYDISPLSNNFASIEIFCDTNSQFNLHVFDFGSHNSVQNITINLKGDLSKVNLNSVYFGTNFHKLSFNYLINIFGKKCDANMDVCGVLNAKSQKNFLGTINFKKGSSKSVGSESEHCVLLSNLAKANSTPILLSAEEDVNGKHSSSIGKIDDEELFYIMCRGISKSEATKMLVKAKLSNISNKLFDENLKNEILKRIDEKIDE